MAEECGAVDAIVLGASELTSAFALKREFIPIALESSAAATVLKINVQPRQMSEALANAAREADNNRLRWVAMARGLGVIYFAMLPTESGDASRQQVIRAADNILAACDALGGHATIPWCPTEWKSALKIWGLPRADFAQMLKLKKVFDPAGVFSPGRFVGGI
jgi:FAD/FMN-containing dehydrogenase